eukprot:CAMPEP_0113308004 /NCGR_PEP_ID=MMETSP0010_2-20120614/6618_1 /TAXON_ID=216773 ORGANISM="Corethron hystrix, Strain 308" /NCGR_SAMPLE_ID=MMETSP0010_2 /ASSEMBLY_ACC=CAM_ASM_000155 /LENGTH=75 /DNA_ID=CAMNT_0000162963 /DNA_START=561 /DNA_END=789 /DNA_ORIENTATION=+ /assembly_acc=CAM_ASM_000155
MTAAKSRAESEDLGQGKALEGMGGGQDADLIVGEASGSEGPRRVPAAVVTRRLAPRYVRDTGGTDVPGLVTSFLQ